MQKEKWMRFLSVCSKCVGGASLALAAALLLFPLPGNAQAAAAPAQIDSINVAKTDQSETARPESLRLIPLGRTTGIKLFSEGAMVVGFAPLDSGKSPAEAAGLQIGDLITQVNSQPVSSNETMAQAVSQAQGGPLTVQVKRNGEQRQFTVQPVQDPSSGQYRIGAWVRDSLAGIGTITYVDPKNGAFGALGHGVCDQDTGELMPIGGGSLMRSQVVSVKKGQSGQPGELTGEYELTRDQGVLYQNADNGIYGKLTDEQVYSRQQALETAPKTEIHTGKAQIIANVEGSQTQSYEIEIVKIYEDDQSNRDMMVQVTDKKLLEKTGGIVQGMSGSPIVQNGKLVGAVTHVLVNDPQRGYAISIERMLETARSL